MPVTFPDDLLESAHLTEQELRVELAVTLFQQDRLTLGQCARYSDISQVEMQRVLAGRRIPLHYGFEELEADLAWGKTAVCAVVRDSAGDIRS
jgi:predicted HTH domain antitoxin